MTDNKDDLEHFGLDKSERTDGGVALSAEDLSLIQKMELLRRDRALLDYDAATALVRKLSDPQRDSKNYLSWDDLERLANGR